MFSVQPQFHYTCEIRQTANNSTPSEVKLNQVKRCSLLNQKIRQRLRGVDHKNVAEDRIDRNIMKGILLRRNAVRGRA